MSDIESVKLPKHGLVEVCQTTAYVNPSPGDLARMLAQNPGPLRALGEPGKFVIWPSEQELHQPVQIAFDMDRRARRYFVIGNPHRSSCDVVKVGRFYVRIIDSANTPIVPKLMNPEMLMAFGLHRHHTH